MISPKGHISCGRVELRRATTADGDESVTPLPHGTMLLVGPVRFELTTPG